MCVFLWPSSFLAVLLFALNSAAASTRPGACATTLAKHLTRPTRAHTSTDQTCVASRLSLSLSSLNPGSTRPDLARVRASLGPSFFFPPSIPSAAYATRSAPYRVVSPLPVLTACSDGFTSYFADRLRRRSPIQPYALPDRTSYTVCFVCLFVRAVPLYFRSTYTVQGPLCPNREPC